MSTTHWYYCNLVNDEEISAVVPVVQKCQNVTQVNSKASMVKTAVAVTEVDEELAVRRSTFVLEAELAASMKSSAIKADRLPKKNKKTELIEMKSVKAALPDDIDTSVTSAIEIAAEKPVKADKKDDEVETEGEAGVETVQDTNKLVRVIKEIDLAESALEGAEEESDVQIVKESADFDKVADEPDKEMDNEIQGEKNEVGLFESEKAEPVQLAPNTIEGIAVVVKNEVDVTHKSSTTQEEESKSAVEIEKESVDIDQVAVEPGEEMTYEILGEKDEVGMFKSEKAESVQIAANTIEINAVVEENEAELTQKSSTTQEEESGCSVEIAKESDDINQVAVESDAQMDHEILEEKPDIVGTPESTTTEAVKTVHNVVEIASVVEEKIDVTQNFLTMRVEKRPGQIVNESSATSQVIVESHEQLDLSTATRTHETVEMLELSSSEAAAKSAVGEESETETQSEISEVPVIDAVEASKLSEESDSEIDETMLINPKIAAKENAVVKAQASWYNFIPEPIRNNGCAVSSVGVVVATVIAAALMARR